MVMTQELDGATKAPEPNVYAGNPGEFAATWNAATEERRQEWMGHARWASQTAQRCWLNQHEERIQWAETKLAAVQAALAETATMTLNPGARDALDAIRTALATTPSTGPDQ